MQRQGMSESAQRSAFDSPCVNCNAKEASVCKDCLAFTVYVRRIRKEEMRALW
jgi:hypothetical protein